MLTHADKLLENAPCEKTFYADEGSVEIIALDDRQFAARYDDVVYKEVTISRSSTSLSCGW